MYIMTKVGQLKNVNLFLGKHNGQCYILKILIFAVKIIIQIIVDQVEMMKNVQKHQKLSVMVVVQVQSNLKLSLKARSHLNLNQRVNLLQNQ